MRVLLLFAALALNAAESDLFEKQVRPVLAAKCFACHGAVQQMAGLRLDSRDSALKGGKRGAAIVPGNPDESLLVKAVRRDGLAMPPDRPLSASETKAIEEWIRGGAVWPAETAAKGSATHWAFASVRKTAIPSIDSAIRTRLAKDGLKLASPADRRTLIRRLSFVLTGLPPSAGETDAFVADGRSDAYARVADRLLASDHFGEHWARHWMDVVRFGETHGYEWNYEIQGAWRYRDYLIRAFNTDVPYDQLIREHIAGDLLERPRVNRAAGINESIVGTAFYRLGEVGHDDCIEFREICLDVVDNQIDTLGKAFQGLTISCARCHDHKVDPIPTSEYYALAGVLASSRQVVRNIDTGAAQAASIEQLKKLKGEIRAELAKAWRENADGMWERLVEANAERIDDALYPWAASIGGRTLGDIAKEYAAEIAVRDSWMRENAVAFDDGWFAEGLGLKDGRAAAGEFAVSVDAGSAVTGVYPAGWYTHLISEKSGGALRSAFLPKTKKFISLELAGGKLGARRTVIDNGPIGEAWEVLKSDSLKWMKTSAVNNAKLPVFVELVTKDGNPRIPDRPGVIKGFKESDLDSVRSYFGFTRAVLHDADAAPKPDLRFIARLFDGGGELGARYVELTRSAIDAFAAGKAADEDARWLDAMLRARLLENREDLTERLAELIAEYRKVEAAMPAPRWASGMAESGQGIDVEVLPYGDWKNPGAKSARRFLSVVTGSNEPWRLATGSGRIQLAEAMASKANPLTARVMVNRVWHYMFGRGIVGTVDNFGAIGDTPSHPELLDYLAAKFVEEGWSVKKLVRAIAMSETFQQSNVVTALAREKDPRNRLLHHYPVRRLEAEPIRDALLAVSGNLDERLYGPSVQPYRETAKDYRRLFSGPLDGAGRRSVYLKVTRMEGPRFLEIFDFPPPLTTRGARDTTNVPAQALAMLNDPLVLHQADVWAAKLVERRGDTVESRIQYMYGRAIGREASPEELGVIAGLARQVGGLRSSAVLLSDQDVWKDVAHAMFNLKEFLYIR